MCVERKKCNTFTIFLYVYAQKKQRSGTNKNAQDINGWHVTTFRTTHKKRLSTVNVTGDVQGRRASFSSCTGDEAADLTRRRRRRRRPPSARAARQRIPYNDVSDGVAPSFTIGEAADPTRRTSLDNVLSVLQNRLKCHVLRRTAFIAGQSRGRLCRSR